MDISTMSALSPMPPTQDYARRHHKSLIRADMDLKDVDKIFEDRYPLNVSVIGSGNWGSTIAKIIGHTVTTNWRFNNDIKMYVHEEVFNGKKLSEQINEMHENPKYLPGVKIPENVRACPSLPEVVSNSDVLIFVLPHQFVASTCKTAKPHVKPDAFAISLIKGFLEGPNKEIMLVSNIISKMLDIPCDVLMGANIAREVAENQFCESTIGSTLHSRGHILKSLLGTSTFRVSVSSDKDGVEICGAAKNVIAVGAGLVNGMDQGKYTAALIIQHGMVEMLNLMRRMSKDFHPATILESCGFADILTSADGGRNARVAEQFARNDGKKSWEELERDMLKGQKLQGVQTAAMIYLFVKNNKLEKEFPLFIAIHEICVGLRKIEEILEAMRIGACMEPHFDVKASA